MRVPDHPHFAAESPVGRYWLAHGHGFAVVRADGRRLGVVEDLALAADGQTVERVLVRRRGVPGRYAQLEATELATVFPRSRVFVVGEAPAPAPAPARARAPRAAGLRATLHAVPPLLQRASRAGGRAAHGLGSMLDRAAAVARPRLAHLGHRVAEVSRAGARQAGRGADASAEAAAAAARRARQDAPRVAARLSAAARAAGRSTHVLLRTLRRYAEVGARAAAAAARRAARFLGDLAVDIAVVVADAWRGAGAAGQPEPQEPAPAAEAEPDADEPLTRDPGDWPGAARIARRGSAGRRRVPVPGAEPRKSGGRRRAS